MFIGRKWQFIILTRTILRNSSHLFTHAASHTHIHTTTQFYNQLVRTLADLICPYQITCSLSLLYCLVTLLSLWPLCLTVLAFALGDTKQVVLCDVEKAEILHLFTVENAVSCMHWMEVVEESK